MDFHHRDRLVAAISARRLRLRIQGRSYYLISPTPADRAVASDVHLDALLEAEDLLNETQALDLLSGQDLWSEKDAKDLIQVEKDIDELKVWLFRSKSSQDRDTNRNRLRQAKEAQSALLCRRHANADVTQAGFAALARSRCLIGRCLQYPDGRPVWVHESYWSDDVGLLDDAVRAANEAKPTEGHIRELARSDPWRSIWACRENSASLFDGPAVSWSDEQRSLVAWSRLYDVARDDQDGPPEWVFEDDDAFDGWLITRRRERENDMKKRKAEALLSNPKLANANEIFVPVESMEEAAEIAELNEPVAAGFRRARLEKIQSQGEVLEANMPDSQLQIRRQLAARGIS